MKIANVTSYGRSALTRQTRRSFEENYGRANIGRAAAKYAERHPERTSPVVIDLGAGYGRDLITTREVLPTGAEMHAVEFELNALEALESLGFHTTQVDIERDSLPFADESVDIVIANQVIEHTKELFWIFGEIQRVLRPGGVTIIGVPNIASFHNRVGMLFGVQPTQIEVLSAHVRGFTYRSFVKFVEAGGCFKVISLEGANFYPFPPAPARLLARAFPKASWGLTITVERLDTDRKFIQILDDETFETPFYKGPPHLI